MTMQHEFKRREIKTTERLHEAIEKVVGIFAENDLTYDEANAVLSMIAAIGIHEVQLQSPKARGHEKEMAQTFAYAILGNLELLNKSNPINPNPYQA